MITYEELIRAAKYRLTLLANCIRKATLREKVLQILEQSIPIYCPSDLGKSKLQLNFCNPNGKSVLTYTYADSMDKELDFDKLKDISLVFETVREIAKKLEYDFRHGVNH